jgi:uncharacterized membrane protein (UPF0136 family)
MTDWLGYTYAGLIALGGVIGYVKASSVVSLVTAVTFGGLFVGALRYQTNVYPTLMLSVLLSIVMGVRFMRSGKWMPAGIVTLLSIFMSLRYGMRLIK